MILDLLVEVSRGEECSVSLKEVRQAVHMMVDTLLNVSENLDFFFEVGWLQVNSSDPLIALRRVASRWA